MSFEHEGWLGEDSQAFIRRCEKEFAPNLAITRKTNILAHEVLNGLSLNNINSQHLLSAALFIRILESSQAAVHLIRLGLRHDAAAVIRVGIESLILLKNACRAPDFGRRYVARGSKKSLLRTTRGIPQDARNELEEDIRTRLESAEFQLTEMVGKLGEQSGSLEKLAQDVGLGDLYDGAYRLFSASVHSESGTVAGYFEESHDGSIQHIDYAPDWRYTGVYLFAVCDLLLLAMESLEEVFGGSHKEDRELIGEELERLSPRWPDPKGKQSI